MAQQKNNNNIVYLNIDYKSFSGSANCIFTPKSPCIPTEQIFIRNAKAVRIRNEKKIRFCNHVVKLQRIPRDSQSTFRRNIYCLKFSFVSFSWYRLALQVGKKRDDSHQTYERRKTIPNQRVNKQIHLLRIRNVLFLHFRLTLFFSTCSSIRTAGISEY